MPGGFAVQTNGSDILLRSLNQLLNTPERPPANPAVGDLCKKTFHQIEPRRAGRREVQMVTRMGLQPVLYVCVCMGPVVIENQMDFPRGYTANTRTRVQSSIATGDEPGVCGC